MNVGSQGTAGVGEADQGEKNRDGDGEMSDATGAEKRTTSETKTTAAQTRRQWSEMDTT